MRAVFFGTPDFAVPALEALATLPDTEIAFVVCQPDRPQGRGLTLTPPPVKQRALSLGLRVLQPTKLRDGALAAEMREARLDLALVIAYGRILPADVLAAPRLGCINIHGSLLPRYRGAAPITWAVVRGEKESGLTLMQMDAGMDTGAMLEKFPCPVGPDETAGELSARLRALGADAVRVGLPKVLAGAYVPQPQDDTQATLAPILKKEDGRIDFARPARQVHDHVRGMMPWPGAFTSGPSGPTRTGASTKPSIVKVLATRVLDERQTLGSPGTVLQADKLGVLVACAPGFVELSRVQLEGRKPVTAAEWAGGRGVAENDVLGVPQEPPAT
jgi:methionyl-tRNA formyltransferase